MYSVYLDGSMLYHTNLDTHTILQPELNLDAGRAGSFQCIIPPENPAYTLVKRIKSNVKVYRDNLLLFQGRVLRDSMNFDKFMTIYCEGDLALLNDSIIRPYVFTGSISEFIDLILAEHNSQVDASKQFTRGNVTVIDNNDYIRRSSSQYPSAWSELYEKLEKLAGGYFMVRYENNIRYLDYLADSNLISGQVINFGENLLDVQRDGSGEEIVTAVIPLGQTTTTVDEETGVETQETLTISSVNGGVDYITNAEAVAQYGVIMAQETWPDITVAANLKARAEAWLAEKSKADIFITIQAADLQPLGLSASNFKIFEYVHIISTLHDIDDLFLVKSLSLKLDDDSSNLISVGTKLKSSSIQGIDVEKAVEYIQADYVPNEQMTSVRENLSRFDSLIQQTAQQISTLVTAEYVTASELSTQISQLSTQMTQTANQWSFDFSEMQTTVQQLDSSTSAEFTAIRRFIRFIGGKIVLGEESSPLSVEISNTEIAFMDGGAKVAYISGKSLFITSAIIVDNMQIGNHRIKRWGASDILSVMEFVGRT